MEEEYLSVKDFAAAAGVTTQYIYKILGTHLKPYKKKIQKKTYVATIAIDLVKNGFDSVEKSTVSTSETNQNATRRQEPLQPMQPTDQPTKTTDFATIEESGEVQALKELIKELRQDKEDLKRDKEDLKQEALKWQQLLIEERNKVKLLEAAAAEEPREEVVNFEEPAAREIIEEPAAVAEPQELPKTFGEKLKWLFSKK